MARLTVVSFRLGGTDGVSIEAEKWITAFRALGHDVKTVAGDGHADVIMSELAIRAGQAPDLSSLSHALASADVVIVENMASLPLNVTARDALYHVLEGRRALFRHHDLAWQRLTTVDDDAPRRGANWSHVTINDLSRRELLARGVSAQTIRNTFECDPPVGRRELTRLALHVSDEDAIVLFPTRAIPRKNVAGALTLAESLDAVLWLLGPPEDGYDDTLRELVANSRARVVTGLARGLDIHDAYAGCDLVVMPSTWEGFGNPVLESVTHRKPLAVYPYPVLEEIAAFGFRFFALEDVGPLADFLKEPDDELLAHNASIARQHFNAVDLPATLTPLLEALGVK
jgi:glycosyltransferase involved in cell wall biosynthesis